MHSLGDRMAVPGVYVDHQRLTKLLKTIRKSQRNSIYFVNARDMSQSIEGLCGM